MNTFPPPRTSPAEPPAGRPRTDNRRRRATIAGAVAGAGAVIAAGFVVSAAIAADDGAEPPSTQVAGTDGPLDEALSAVGPFLTCVSDNVADIDLPEGPSDLEDLPTLLDDAVAAGEALWEACGELLPTELPDIVPGQDLLDDLADLELADIPGLAELWAELAESADLPSLEEAQDELEDILDELPTWEELQEEFEAGLEGLPTLDDLEQLLDDLDTGNLEQQLDDLLDDLDTGNLEQQLDDLLGNLDTGNLPALDDLLDDLDTGNLPALDDLLDDLEQDLGTLFEQLDEEFGDLGLDDLEPDGSSDG